MEKEKLFRCRVRKVGLLLIVTLLILLSSSVTAQRLQSKLIQKVKAFDSDNSSTVSQLVDFAQRFQIPMGIEWVDNSNEKAAASMHAQNTTAQRILQQIVQEKPGITFTLSGGVVHVFTSSCISDSQNFLNLRIRHFQVENETLLGAEWLLRVAIHEVLNPRPGGYGGGHGHGVPRSDTFDVRNLSFSINNATVRQILNIIAVRQGNALWVVRILPSQMMRNGRFYAQAPSTTGKEVAPDFHWEFIPLKDLKK